MTITHISDTHGYQYHRGLEITQTDVFIHSGDIGGRTDIRELTEFLIWFESQPAILKIFVAGNHDIIMDKKMNSNYSEVLELLKHYNIKYLDEKEYVWGGVKFFGSPYSPSFGYNWAFNSDRGEQIKKNWAKIPSDVNVLITHTPVYGILDQVEDRYKRYPGEDTNVGCKDLLDVIKKRLFNLKLHCSGHIHGQYGVVQKTISRTRNVLFSNGAIINNNGDQLVYKPLIITI